MNICIVEKPDEINWDEIAELLHDAHLINKVDGFELPTAHLTGTEIKKEVGNGNLYVAFVDGEIAGCCALVEKNDKYWFWDSPCAMQILFCVKREYQGMGVGKKIDEKVILEAFKKYSVIIGSTAEQNNRRIKLLAYGGYEMVDYFSWPDTKHYSVIYAKWKDTPPNKNKCKIMFLWRRFRCRLLRRSDGKLRKCWEGIYYILKKKKV